jgi:NusA N-terminal domain
MSDLQRERLAHALEDAIAAEATSVLGAERIISPAFDSQTGRVRLFQSLTVVANVERPGIPRSGPQKLDHGAREDLLQ